MVFDNSYPTEITLHTEDKRAQGGQCLRRVPLDRRPMKLLQKVELRSTCSSRASALIHPRESRQNASQRGSPRLFRSPRNVVWITAAPAYQERKGTSRLFQRRCAAYAPLRTKHA